MIAEAIEWRLRLHDGCAADWQSFVIWLEGEASRSRAYDEIVFAEEQIDLLLTRCSDT